jgi:hypothetical protein
MSNDVTITAGRDGVRIGDIIINTPPPMPPSSSDPLANLENSLQMNRASLERLEKEIVSLAASGRALSDASMQAAIRNLLSLRGCIEVLIPAINLRGGRSSFTAAEAVPPADRIQELVQQGQFKTKAIIGLVVGLLALVLVGAIISGISEMISLAGP